MNGEQTSPFGFLENIYCCSSKLKKSKVTAIHFFKKGFEY